MATKPCRVLVVDDDKDVAQTFAYLLVCLGHEATFLTDPHQVFETVDRVKPHIVFLDIAMPGMDGWEVAKRLRRHSVADGALRLVAVSGSAEPGAHIKSRQAGFDAHVAKPVEAPLLESIINQLKPC